MNQDPVINPNPPVPVVYVIIAMKQSNKGFSVFWRENGHGYTTDLDQAGRFEEAWAKGLEESNRGDRDDIAVPLADCEAKARRFVTDDDAHTWFRSRNPR